VTDAEVHEDVLARVGAAGRELGLALVGQMASPIEGKKSGNREFLVLWRTPASPASGAAAPA
jgi:predicted rRNA methylase YqxC with S4 and FtsJ domains